MVPTPALRLLLAAVALAPCALPAAAQQVPPAQPVETIVVTAQKREQLLKDVPLAITAVSGERLAELHVRELTDLYRFTPGMTSAPDYSFIELTTIRGIGTNSYGFGADPAIGVYANGVYQGRNGAQVSSFYDVERVEVVKGPQATLFGRSSIAGAISVVTMKPGREPSGEITVGYGQRNTFGLDASGDLPVGERFGLRAALHFESEDGFIHNDATGEELRDTTVGAGRVTALYDGQRVDATLVVSYEDREEAGNAFQALGAGLHDFHVRSEVREEDQRALYETFDTSLELVFELGGGFSLTSLTGFRDAEFDYAEDFDGVEGVYLSSPFQQAQDDELLQQELRLAWQSDAITLIGGFSIYDEHLSGYIGNLSDLGVATNGDPGSFTGETLWEVADFDGDYWGWSLYVDGSWQATPRLELTAGARYAFDAKRLAIDAPDPAGLARNAGSPGACACYMFGFFTSGEVGTRDDWDGLTFRAALTFALNDDVSLYAGWSQGWKAGGIDSFGVDVPAAVSGDLFTGTLDLGAVGGQLDPFEPEKSHSIEAGLRGSWLDGRLALDLSPYFYTYEDLQVATLQGAALVVDNVGRAHGAGIETELDAAPFGWLSLTGVFAYGWTEIQEDEDDPGEEGRPLVQAPRVTAALGFEATRQAMRGGEIYFAGEWSYQGDARAQRGSDAEVDEYDILDVRLGYRSRGRFDFELYVENVFDEFAGGLLVPQEDFVSPVTTLSALVRTRTFGAIATVRF